MTQTATVALFDGPGDPFRLEARPLPTPSDGELLVEIELATVCGSDLHTVDGRRSAPTPCVLGHEAVGRVVASKREPFGVGDRVTWSVMSCCGACDNCARRGLPQKCDRLVKYGHAASDESSLNGCYATHILLDGGTAVFRVPAAVSPAMAAPLNCAASTVWDGLAYLNVEQARSAVVFGAGTLGLYASAMLRARGLTSVTVIDPNDARRAVAKSFGATETRASAGGALEADIAVEATGAPAALASALESLRVGGQCLTLGYVFPGAFVTVNADLIVRNCLTIRGNHNYRPDALGGALEFVSANRDRFPFESLVGPTFPLTRIGEAFEVARRGEHIRVAVDPRVG